MRGLLAVGLVLLGAAGSAEAPDDLSFARELPAEVGDVSSFEVVSGTFTSPAASGRYRFYVNPRWQALYQVMRYRVRFAVDGEAVPTERVVWNRQPGRRSPLVVWARIATAEPVQWRPIAPGTDEYLSEMGRLIQVLSAQSAARREEAR